MRKLPIALLTTYLDELISRQARRDKPNWRRMTRLAAVRAGLLHATRSSGVSAVSLSSVRSWLRAGVGSSAVAAAAVAFAD